jgi:hypothetical protein
MARHLFLCLLVGCAERKNDSAVPSSPVPIAATASARAAATTAATAASTPTLIATHKRSRAGKPPLEQHFFDVAVRNPSSEARWIVIPSTFPSDGEAWPKGNETEVQSFQLGDNPRVVLAHAVVGHFYAVRLPGHGTLMLRELPISSWWSEPRSKATLPVVLARDLRVGGEPIDKLLGFDAASASGADVTAQQGAGDARAKKFWHPERADAAIAIDEASRQTFTLTLPSL